MRTTLAILCAVTLLLASTSAVPHVIRVPFFTDSGGNLENGIPEDGGVVASIAVRNTLGQEITMYLVYWQADPANEPVMQQAVSFELAAFEAVAFRPVKDDPNEGAGRSVPNMLPGLGNEGGVDIIWIGGPEMTSAIIGRYQQITSGSDFAYLLTE
jgi:hypothetical protein